MKTLIIDRKKWRRGHPGDTFLLSPEGMCCLGFYCINEGFSESEIDNHHTPITLGVKIKGIIYQYEDYLRHTNTCDSLMATNDKPKSIITEEKRENKITSLFKKIGREVKFIN